MSFSLTTKKTVSFPFIFLVLFLPVFVLNAYEIRDTSTEMKNDFVLEPAKLEVFLDPGGTQTEMLNILNRTDKTLEFNIEIEDFSGSHDPNQTVILLGEEKGPYSLRDYLSPEINSFSLKPGQKITFPVDVSVPFDAEPGGLYGSILISSGAEAKGQAGTTVVSRLGALFFVNISGEIIKNGELTSFTKVDSGEDRISFELLFENKGSIHLNPYGFIKVFNLVGTQVSEIEIKPYFAMPDSVRFRKIDWNSGKLFGKYKAVATINRGYDDIVDEMSVVFWVIPMKILMTVVGVILLLILIIIWLIKNFDFNITKDKRTKDGDEASNGSGDSKSQQLNGQIYPKTPASMPTPELLQK